MTSPNHTNDAARKVGAVCIYCASSNAMPEASRQAAVTIGQGLAARSQTLVYGGGRVGLMGLAADAALAAGGRVTGIIPDLLMRAEVGHQGLSELIVTESMHTRKQIMVERADAFLILPGGVGTLDEFFEVLTWRQLGLHDKPICIVDVDGFWAPLTALMDHMVAKGAMRQSTYALADTVNSAQAALDWVDTLG